MNKNSIIFSTTLNYIITIVLLIFSFAFLFTNEKFTQEEQIFDRYKHLTKMLHKQRGELNIEFKNILQEMNYEIFLKEDIEEILKNRDRKIVFSRNKGKDVFEIFELAGKNYILFENNRDRILIKDNESLDFSSNLYLILVFFFLFFVVSFLYIRTLRKLLPLKVLKDKVINLGEEKFDFDFSSTNGKDEVALLAYEFQKSALKLKNIKESRNIFIRNIMHELKTPITKGKFLLQLEKSEENNEKLKMVFNKLEALINEFATIEELISQNKTLEKKSYFLEDLLDNAKDILMLDDSCVICKYQNIKLNVNFKLFSIAIKNLIDNAIKYSEDKKVTIKTNNDELLFINSGKKLEGSFENYLEPFYVKSSQESFGLGLYIVFNILKANGYNLFYKYEDSKNIFTIKKG